LSKPPNKDMQDKAEASFKRKEIQARDATKAMAEYEASLTATRDKTARLKALRMAKEAADAAAPPPEPKPKAKAAKKK
jgi:hypothetical protein